MTNVDNDLFHASPYIRARVIADTYGRGLDLSGEQIHILSSDPVWSVRAVLAHYRDKIPKNILEQLQNDPNVHVQAIASSFFLDPSYLSKDLLFELLHYTLFGGLG